MVKCYQQGTNHLRISLLIVRGRPERRLGGQSCHGLFPSGCPLGKVRPELPARFPGQVVEQRTRLEQEVPIETTA